MSLSDIGWKRSLYAGAVLSLVAAVMMWIFVVPPFKKDIIPGSEWIFIGTQCFIAVVLFCIGWINKREKWISKAVILILAISLVLLGLLGFLIAAMEEQLNHIWKLTTRMVALDEIIIAFILFYSCI